MHGANADTGTVKVIAPTGCKWQVTTDDSWLTAKASGTGNGRFNYTVAQNPNSKSRNGSLTLADQTFSVTQTGNVAPTAVFTASPLFGKAPLTVLLDASASTDQEGSSGLTYQWRISDGRTLSGVAPQITFTEAGQYTINLVVTDAAQTESQNIAQTILVEKANQSPIATFTLRPNMGQAPLQVDLDASQSRDPDGRIINYQWASSEGQKTLGQTASLTFNDTGMHNITLTVIDSYGEKGTTEQSVIVQAPAPGLMPVFSATPTEGEAPLTVSLDASGSSPQSAISQYDWNTTDEQFASGRTGETFTFTDPGKYLITLTITGKDGSVKSTQKTVLVKAKPVARFIAIPNVVKLSSPEVQLDASESFDPDGTVVDYRWTTSDAQKASGKITSLFFKTEGQYEIELVVTDDAGLKSTNIARQTITVVPEYAQLNPIAIIDVDDKEAVLQRTVKLSAKRSRDVDGEIVQYDWTTSDNQKDKGEEVSFNFVENGDYTITLTVTDNDGLTAQDDSTISVGERVIVEFQGLKSFYEVGETLKVDLIENLKVKSRFDRVDLWVGIQIPNGNVLFKTPEPLKPFGTAPKPFKESLETLNVAHRLLDFEVIPGLGGEYILYALYVPEGKTPFGEGGYEAVQRSNLAHQSTSLANFANFGLHQAELEALEAVDQIENVIVKADGEFSFKFEGITHYGKLGQITQGSPPSNGILNVEIINDANDDGIPDIRFTYPNGDKQNYYYLGFYE
jgi:PKD repeat protein